MYFLWRFYLKQTLKSLKVNTCEILYILIEGIIWIVLSPLTKSMSLSITAG